MYKGVDWLQNRSGWLRRGVNRRFYNYLAGVDRQGIVTLMNYGYAYLEQGSQPIRLDQEDEQNRYCLQLYERVAGAVDIKGGNVLEVGSGRGGGASFIKRYLGPRTVTGVDYSEKAVEFCQQRYRVHGLSFIHGDAENLPLEDEQFDAVINVESSHCYAWMERFLGEVWRVLKPGGHLLWADHRTAAKLEDVKAKMHSAGFGVVSEEVISQNVLKSMALQGQRNREMINRNVPKLLRDTFFHFSGVEGTHIYNQISSGELVYMRMALRKP